MKSIEVEIFGRLFRLRSDNPTRTLKIAEDLSEELTRLYENYENLDFARLLLLACFQREDKLQTALEENRELKAELSRVNQMLENIISI
ncbi:MAG: cell division protein ZapA [Candidatus Cloacimonadaceae bacterium]|jgi:cell division protein ZapA (FtsZ GTPase activity inhibitor)|nr:cell division protein ZapA [Candidatus Cloacimonadota bacterium]MDY0126863.1 cell division protein ZapA [Candidatus Cloacimonadaceae bacterium]MCB5254586.1 cell division protein ZapA [Candidatus Cloacimonadota bacterium]MCK9178672.1 cell division protein ZapA [Candidatus Cloacimonadota bacterium]MCK9242270.1 cell division protein ZapA [Candidatus Cloacimonadota bacterium]